MDAIFKDDVEIFHKLNKRRNRTTQLGSIEHNSTVLREILLASGWAGNGQVDRESVVELIEPRVDGRKVNVWSIIICKETFLKAYGSPRSGAAPDSINSKMNHVTNQPTNPFLKL